METVVIRLWTPADEAQRDPALKGLAQHVGSGRRLTFSDTCELVAFLATTVAMPRGVADTRARTDEADSRGDPDVGRESGP